MASKTEELVSRSLRSVLDGLADGATIEDSEELRDLLSGLEYYLPAVLSELHKEWKYESMDGFHLAVARKTGPGEAELIGLCILISDQTLTPIYVRLQVPVSGNEIVWLECRVGKSGEGKGGMTRIPYESAKVSKLLFNAVEMPDAIEWVYKAGFGQRRKES